MPFVFVGLVVTISWFVRRRGDARADDHAASQGLPGVSDSLCGRAGTAGGQALPEGRRCGRVDAAEGRALPESEPGVHSVMSGTKRYSPCRVIVTSSDPRPSRMTLSICPCTWMTMMPPISS